MSSIEYNDLFLLCQNTGKYHMFTFDMVASKAMDKETRTLAQRKMITLMKYMYQLLMDIQEKTQKKILVFEEDFISYDSGTYVKGFGMKQEPFLIGDVFGFTIYRDSIDKDIILNIYQYFKDALEIDFDFHVADGYYETNDYSLGSTQYFRGYCMDILSNFHKKEIIDDLNNLRSKLKKPNSN